LVNNIPVDALAAFSRQGISRYVIDAIGNMSLIKNVLELKKEFINLLEQIWNSV